VNLYAYAGNSPVNFSDPFGLCPPEHPETTADCPKGVTAVQVSISVATGIPFVGGTIAFGYATDTGGRSMPYVSAGNVKWGAGAAGGVDVIHDSGTLESFRGLHMNGAMNPDSIQSWSASTPLVVGGGHSPTSNTVSGGAGGGLFINGPSATGGPILPATPVRPVQSCDFVPLSQWQQAGCH